MLGSYFCGTSNSDPEILTYVAGANSLKQSNDPVASNVYPLPQMYAVAQCARQTRTIQKTTKLRWPCLKCNQLYQQKNRVGPIASYQYSFISSWALDKNSKVYAKMTSLILFWNGMITRVKGMSLSWWRYLENLVVCFHFSYSPITHTYNYFYYNQCHTA